MPLVGLQYVIIIFPDHTCLLFEHDQEMPQLQTTDQPMALRGRDTEHRQSHNSKNTIKAKQPALLGKMFAKPERTLRNTLKNKECTQTPTHSGSNSNQ